jgi:hypothetical protein
LTSIVIPNSVRTISSNVFLGCDNLTIYAETTNPANDPTSPAHGWHSQWNPDNRPVVWDFDPLSEIVETVYVNALISNYPNPFNPETTIRFTVGVISTSPHLKSETSTTNQQVQIHIYNIRGQRVRTLVDGVFAVGEYSVVWNGTDDIGKNVGSGVYFYKLSASGFQSVKRMVLLK